MRLSNHANFDEYAAKNVAWLDFLESDQAADAKRWKVVPDAGVLKLQTLDDAGAVVATLAQFTRTGNLVLLGDFSADEISAVAITLTGDLSAQDITLSGNLSAVDISAASVTLTGDVSAQDVTASAAVSGASVTATGAVSGASVTATGAVSGASVTASGAVSGATLAATGTITGGATIRGKNDYTFATLPTAAAAGDGARAYITDSTLAFTGANIGSNAAGGGTNHSPVIVVNGTWKIG